jgi:hypothetical protein
MNYTDFLKTKVKLAKDEGESLDATMINPRLLDHQKSIVEWMVKGGQRACFASFGLGKSIIQLETVRIMQGLKGGMGLIVIPLGVRQEFVRDSVEILGWENPPKFVRRIEECQDPHGMYLTNYETIRDGKLDPVHFTVASLDEASCLRGFGGSKTFREFMRLFTGDGGPCNDDRADGKTVPYRFVATATPSPNDYIELLAYADFLGIMDVSQAKTRFFKRDSTKADKLTLHPHKEEEFWLWVSSWALFVQKPSDLGFSDAGYDMPDLVVEWHEVESDHSTAGWDKLGQRKLLKDATIGVQDAAAEKRESMSGRIAKMVEIRNEYPDDHVILWHDLEDERRAIQAAIPTSNFPMANTPNYQPSRRLLGAVATSSVIATGRYFSALDSSSMTSSKPFTGCNVSGKPTRFESTSSIRKPSEASAKSSKESGSNTINKPRSCKESSSNTDSIEAPWRNTYPARWEWTGWKSLAKTSAL